MYDSQPEISFRDAYEIGLVSCAAPMDDASADAAEFEMALRDGFDPFAGFTIAEFYKEKFWQTEAV